jgi:hypothetical protein
MKCEKKSMSKKIYSIFLLICASQSLIDAFNNQKDWMLKSCYESGLDSAEYKNDCASYLNELKIAGTERISPAVKAILRFLLNINTAKKFKYAK